MNQREYVIRLGRLAEIPLLPIIERNAGVLFLPFHEPGLSSDRPVTDVEALIKAQENGTVWVAANKADLPVGFAHVEVFGNYAHLHELDVDLSHQRRGLGSALLRQVCAWADASAISAITLRTFLHIPWNAPFYMQHGFHTIPDSERPFDGLSAFIAAEAAIGFNMRARVTMKRKESTGNGS